MTKLYILSKILPWILIIASLAIIGLIIFLKKNKMLISIITLILVVAIFIVIPFLRKKVIENNFKSFDLSELLRDELIIQTIDFNKFIVYGTEEEQLNIINEFLFKYNDELKVYHIQGRAEVIFREIDKLRIVEEDLDYEKGICKIAYDSPDYKNAFTVKVYIENIEVVQDFESEKFIGIDLKRPDQTQSKIIENTKNKLEEEFKNQITKGITKKNITSSDAYKSFILSLEKLVQNYGYKTVEVAFEKNNTFRSQTMPKIEQDTNNAENKAEKEEIQIPDSPERKGMVI